MSRLARAVGIRCGVVEEYIDKFPNTPNLTLAKTIYKNNPEMFTSVENARSTIRYLRGQNGDSCRGKLKDKTRVKEPGPVNPFDNIPEGLTYYKQWKPHPLEYGRTLILADLHIPYHNKSALIAAIKYAQKSGPIDAVLLLGDTLDFYALSFWQNDPRKRHFAEELDMAHDTVDSIRQIFPDTPIIFKEGNHEERLWRYLAVKAPELIGIECLSLSAMIEAENFNLQVVNEKQIITIGRLNLVHGHEFWKTFSSPVNPARGLWNRGKDNALCAHWHGTSDHTEKTMSDKVISCWSMGCLCDLHPDYSPLNNWNLGFAIVELLNERNFHVYNKKIINGEVY